MGVLVRGHPSRAGVVPPSVCASVVSRPRGPVGRGRGQTRAYRPPTRSTSSPAPGCEAGIRCVVTRSWGGRPRVHKTVATINSHSRLPTVSVSKSTTNHGLARCAARGRCLGSSGRGDGALGVVRWFDHAIDRTRARVGVGERLHRPQVGAGAQGPGCGAARRRACTRPDCPSPRERGANGAPSVTFPAEGWHSSRRSPGWSGSHGGCHLVSHHAATRGRADTLR